MPDMCNEIKALHAATSVRSLQEDRALQYCTFLIVVQDLRRL